MQAKILTVFLMLWGAAAMAGPLYPNSVVSNDIDFIRSGDPSVYGCTRYLGQGRKEMPDKRSNKLFRDGTYIYEMQFRDGTGLQVWVSNAVGGQAKAAATVARLQGPLGRLPTLMRKPLNRVVIHAGAETAFAESDGHFFVLYDRNMAQRISTHDLEETVFHEAMHAAIQRKHLRSSAWRRAVRSDGDFVTDYASSQPQEDWAESGLFAYTYLRHPERLPAKVRAALPQIMPARLAFFERLFPAKGREHYKAGGYKGCK